METIYAWTSRSGIRLSHNKPENANSIGSVSMGVIQFSRIFGFVPKDGEVHQIDMTATLTETVNDEPAHAVPA